MRREEKGSDHACSCKAKMFEQKGERGNRQDRGYQAREANHWLAELQSDWPFTARQQSRQALERIVCS